ncbi:hypothetical protein Hthe01_20610 [Hydrogenophilus thermoluteolus]|nr:hypothetical protein Hthe01_20610 [Hydrogenophilus thermoluteolus]
MKVSWSSSGGGDYTLRFGTVGNNYWRGGSSGAVFDRNLYIQVKNVNLISKFTLTRAEFDDWILVQVNGHTVYVGPYGGDRLLLSGGRVQYCDTCFGGVDLSVSWVKNLNIDLRPYLIDGTNTIFMRTIVGGKGEGNIVMTVRQYCPLNCSVTYRNDCSNYESRAR